MLCFSETHVLITAKEGDKKRMDVIVCSLIDVKWLVVGDVVLCDFKYLEEYKYVIERDGPVRWPSVALG